MKVAILGGGVSGAAAARFLDERGVEVDVLEKEERAGGLMRSDVVDGYVFDRAGGHILFSKDEWYRSFARGLFDEEELVTSVRNTKILFDGRFVHYPFENGLGDLEPEQRLRCALGYVEAWVERAKGTPTPDNFGDWIRHRFGEGIAELFMRPYNEKIWKADLHTLGVDWVDGRVPAAPLEDVLRAAMGQRTEGYRHQMVFQYPRRGGFEQIFARIAAPIRHRIRTGVVVERVERCGEGFRVNGERYDAVISTIPLPRLAEVLSGLDSAAREAALALRHRALTSVLIAIDEESSRPYSWIYLPHEHQGAANRVTYLSNYSPENAPLGRASLQAEITHEGPLELGRDDLERLKEDLGRQGLLDPSRAEVICAARNEWAYILFDRGFTRKRRLAIEGVEALGVVPLGRFGRFDYFNSDQCVVAARDAVDRLLERSAAGG